MAKVRVYYKGLSDVRIISKDDLKRHNIEVSEDLVWDRLGEANGGVLKAPRLAINIDAPDELIKVLRDNDTFTVSEIKDDGSIGEELVTGKVVDESELSAKVVDATTGASSAGKGKPSGS